ANARIALDVIDAALAGTAKLRRLKFEAEEETRAMQKRAARHVAASPDPQALVAAGREATGEAVEKAMRYWRQMFEMIVEMQKRLFALMQEQVSGMPGASGAKAMMAMMPDPRQAQGLVDAMQRVMSSGAPALSSMQRAMEDFARMAQRSIPGGKR
ncbi:MAG TPA: TIGR01841 family phasin, partial [Casimicrobiaceae bacterium]|nr:TIGR01841 family phasin [Casimicrobiaceae bacterium]